jgi:DNA-binding GntR family transcriptional regulator
VDIPSREPLFEQIHDILWEKIRSGEIRPGERLKDIVWAKKLGVSRTPVREAMRKMQQEGVLNLLSHGGYEVRATSQKDLIELYRCRAALEALAAEETAAQADDRLVKNLTQLVDDCDAAIERGDLDNAFSLNTKFHTVIVERSNNDHLGSLLETLRKLVLFYRGALLNVAKGDSGERAVYLDRLRVKQQRHREILAAIGSRDGTLAASLMLAHVRETAEDLLPAVRESGSPDSVTMAA